MNRTVYLNKNEYRKERTVTHPNGTSYRIGLSGFDIPRSVTFKYSKQGFTTTFEYIDNESSKKINYYGNTLLVGKHSGKIMGLILSFESSYQEAQSIIRYRLKNITRDNQQMNAELIQDILREYFP